MSVHPNDNNDERDATVVPLHPDAPPPAALAAVPADTSYEIELDGDHPQQLAGVPVYVDVTARTASRLPVIPLSLQGARPSEPPRCTTAAGGGTAPASTACGPLSTP